MTAAATTAALMDVVVGVKENDYKRFKKYSTKLMINVNNERDSH